MPRIVPSLFITCCSIAAIVALGATAQGQIMSGPQIGGPAIGGPGTGVGQQFAVPQAFSPQVGTGIGTTFGPRVGIPQVGTQFRVPQAFTPQPFGLRPDRAHVPGMIDPRGFPEVFDPTLGTTPIAVNVPGGGGGAAASPIEGARYGIAEIIRARGQAIRDVSEAMRNVQQARAHFIENQLRAMEVAFERRDMAQARHRDRYRARRQQTERMLAARPEIEPGLDEDRYDPATAEIRWPEPLLLDRFASQRERVEQLLARRADEPRAREVREGITEAAYDMYAELRQLQPYLSPREYIAARDFLDDLTYTAQHPSV